MTKFYLVGMIVISTFQVINPYQIPKAAAQPLNPQQNELIQQAGALLACSAHYTVMTTIDARYTESGMAMRDFAGIHFLTAGVSLTNRDVAEIREEGFTALEEIHTSGDNAQIVQFGAYCGAWLNKISSYLRSSDGDSFREAIDRRDRGALMPRLSTHFSPPDGLDIELLINDWESAGVTQIILQGYEVWSGNGYTTPSRSRNELREMLRERLQDGSASD